MSTDYIDTRDEINTIRDLADTFVDKAVEVGISIGKGTHKIDDVGHKEYLKAGEDFDEALRKYVVKAREDRKIIDELRRDNDLLKHRITTANALIGMARMHVPEFDKILGKDAVDQLARDLVNVQPMTSIPGLDKRFKMGFRSQGGHDWVDIHPDSCYPVSATEDHKGAK